MVTADTGGQTTAAPRGHHESAAEQLADRPELVGQAGPASEPDPRQGADGADLGAAHLDCPLGEYARPLQLTVGFAGGCLEADLEVAFEEGSGGLGDFRVALAEAVGTAPPMIAPQVVGLVIDHHSGPTRPSMRLDPAPIVALLDYHARRPE